MKAFKTINDYIASYPKHVQQILNTLRKTIQKAAPRADEAMKYGIPTFTFYGNLVHFGAYKEHIGFYPGPKAILEFKKEFSKYEVSKGTVRFPIKKPLPLSLVTKVVKFRIKESIEKLKSKKSAVNGLHIEYHNDGTILAKGKMKAGKSDGYWEWFRLNGVKMRSGYFKKGLQSGEWTTYDAKGKVYKVTQIKEVKMGVSEFPKISAPALRAFATAKIKSLKDLSKWTESELLELHGVGPSAIPVLRKALSTKGLSFKK